MLYNLMNGVIPDYVTWEVRSAYIELLKLHIIDGLNAAEIQSMNRIFKIDRTPMSEGSIYSWIRKYLPNRQYINRVWNIQRRNDIEENKKIDWDFIRKNVKDYFGEREDLSPEDLKELRQTLMDRFGLK